jgi:hypothetical protein
MLIVPVAAYAGTAAKDARQQIARDAEKREDAKNALTVFLIRSVSRGGGMSERRIVRKARRQCASVEEIDVFHKDEGRVEGGGA